MRASSAVREGPCGVPLSTSISLRIRSTTRASRLFDAISSELAAVRKNAGVIMAETTA